MGINLKFQPVFNCSICPTRCDGHSKSEYVFKDDVALSEEAEDWVLDYLATSLELVVKKTTPESQGLPDIEVYRNDKVAARVEVKAQGRAFMQVSRLLPESGLLPYETVALNLSDLDRYIDLQGQEGLPIFTVWRVRRPCLGEGYWGNDVRVLGQLLNEYGPKRRFRRASTQSDFVAGVHKGVTVNYHFSLKELLALDDLMVQIRVSLQLPDS